MKSNLIHGDCLEIMETLPDNSVDLVLTDPPYGTTRCAWDSVIDLDLMWKEIKRVSKVTATIALMANEPFTSKLICSNLKDFKYRLDWKKNKSTGFLNAKRQPLRCIEDICIFYSKPCTYNPQKTTGNKPVNNYNRKSNQGGGTVGNVGAQSGGGSTERYPTNCIDHINVMPNDKSQGVKQHPTQKPVELMEYLIKTYSNEGETVLDFTMGSGTTGVAAVNLNRGFIGIELDKEYFRIAQERIEKLN